MQKRHLKNKKRFVFLGIFYFLLSTLFFLPAHAQDALLDLSIETIPATPIAGQNVTLVAKSFGADLNQSTLSWTYGGKPIATGIGKTRVVVTAPANGRVATATVTATVPDYSTTTASITLNPGSVDLLWEAVDAHTPPFYKGKALLAPEGTFRVVAIPAANTPSQTSFKWSRNDLALEASSGYGKSSILLKHTIFNSREKIVVAASKGLFEGTGTIFLTPQSPEIIAYQKRDGFITYATGYRDTIRATGSGMTVRFEPYFFFTPVSITSNLSFDIKNGNNQLYGDTAINEVVVSKPQTEGESRLSVGVGTLEYSLQNIVKNFSILFE